MLGSLGQPEGNPHDPPTPLWWAAARVPAFLLVGGIPTLGWRLWAQGVPEDSLGWLLLAIGAALTLAGVLGAAHELIRRKTGKWVADLAAIVLLLLALSGLVLLGKALLGKALLAP